MPPKSQAEWASQRAASPSKMIPMTGLSRCPPGEVFSTTMTSVSTAIDSRLPTPRPNITSINAQQLPRQKPMAQPQPPGGSYPFAVGVPEEPERATALIEAACLERAELEHPCDREGGRANHPGMQGQPEPVAHEPVDLSISQKRKEGERCPDEGIASQERSWDRIWASLLPTSMYDHILLRSSMVLK